MKILLILLWFNTFGVVVVAQQWEDMVGGPDQFIYDIESDGEYLIATDYSGGRPMPRQVKLFDGQDWMDISGTEVLNTGGNPIWAVTLYGGNAYCQHFDASDVTGIFRYDGNEWTLVGDMITGGKVWGMKEYEDTLYIFGQFREINGDTNLRHIVKYDGEQFYPAAAPLFYLSTSVPVVKDILFYQDDLYAVGDIKTASGQYNIARWDGQQWNDVGDGFPYVSYPSKLLEYNGYLLINEHPVSYNGTVNGLVAWDGQQFHGMGQITCEHLAGVSHMTVHDGKLWVAGDCTEPLPGFHHYFASYDGGRWCRYDFVESAKYMTVFQDRMYAYLLHYPNGPVHRFVRWMDETEPDWCGEPIYMNVEEEIETDELKVWPNPVREVLGFSVGDSHGRSSLGMTGMRLRVLDAVGREVLYEKTLKQVQGNGSVDVSGLPRGIYFLELTTENGTRVVRKFVKE